MARAKRLPAAERKRRIISSAREAFAASNYWKVSTADLARAADVSEPALYRYFSGKKDLFISTLKASAAELLEAWHRMAATIEDPVETLYAVTVSYYDHLKSRSAAMKLQFQALLEADDPDIRKALRRNFGSFIQFFRELIEDGKRRGLVREDADPDMVAWQILAQGLNLDVIYLLGFEDQINRQKLELSVRLSLDSLRPSRKVIGARPMAAAAIPYDHLPPAWPDQEVPTQEALS